MPYLEDSYKELSLLLEYPAGRVKKGAVSALGQLCVCVHDVSKTGADIPSSQVGKTFYALKTYNFGILFLAGLCKTSA